MTTQGQGWVARRMATVVVALALLVSAFSVARGAVAEWILPFDSNWNNATAWSGGVVPNNTSNVSYLATVSRSLTQYVRVTVDLPTVELTQLHIRNVANVRVPAGSTMLLRDTGAGTSLTRSLVGGGVLDLAGGRLQVAINGGVISGDSSINLANGRIGGVGRIENARLIRGYGTIGSAPGTFDDALRIYNIGSAAGAPNVTRIIADSNTRTLTLGPRLGPGATGDGIINRNATIGAAFGGKLVVLGNQTTFNNDAGVVSADASSELQFAAGVNLTGGSIAGAGTLRIPTGETAVISQAGLGIATTSVEGTLGLHSLTSFGQVNLNNRIVATNLVNAAGGTIRLLPSAIVPALDAAGSSLTNDGTISGGGTISASWLVNGGTITANSPTTPLTLNVSGTGLALSTSGTLRANGGTLVVGQPGTNIGVSGGGGARLVVNSGSALDSHAALHLTAATASNDGTLTLRNGTKLAHVTGNGLTDVRGTLEVGTVRNRLTLHGHAKLLAGSGVSRTSGLFFESGGRLDVTDNPLVIDYDDDTPGPAAGVRSLLQAGALFSSLGHRVGYAEAAAIGAGSPWYGEAIDASTLLVLPTLAGDANLDRSVDFADLLTLAQHYGQPGTFWSDGDFDYSGQADFTDLLSLAQNYGVALLGNGSVTGTATSVSADWALAQSLVPEPTTLGLIGVGGSLLIRRRRR